MNEQFEKRVEAIEALAKRMGLDYFPVVWEEVPREIIWEVASYGLPTRMSHWSFGRSFIHQKTNGEMGYGKIYELIINSNPSYAFLDETNSEVANLLIVAHCIGHSSFFKKNICFAKTNRNMVNQAERNAKTIDEYKNKFGVETVEDWMDVAFALDRHIDVSLGEDRYKYPEPEIVAHEVQPLPYADLFGEEMKPHIIEVIKNVDMPPHPERDILWFLANYAQMLPWQREVMSIIRSESFYFYPQAITKIMNEGWASFWHAEIMLNYDGLSPEEHLDFAKMHASVVNPGSPGNINPYYVGFKVLTDIRKRWDKYYDEGLKDVAFQASANIDKYDENGNVCLSKMTGMQKIFRVMEEEDDVSFIKNYLTRELAEEMELFTYGQRGAHSDPELDDIIIKDRQLHAVQEVMTGRLHNYGMPLVYIRAVRHEDDSLVLVHDKADGRPLDERYTKETLKYVYAVWRKPVYLHTYDRFGKDVTYKHSEGGSSVERANGSGKQIHLRM